MKPAKGHAAREASVLQRRRQSTLSYCLRWTPRAGAATLVLGVLVSCGTAGSASDLTGTGAPLAATPTENSSVEPGAEEATASGSESGAANDIGSSPERRPSTASGTIESAPHVVAQTAEAAAQGYMDAIVRGDFDSAAQWVTPEQQDIVLALGLGRGPHTLPTMTGRVRVGTVLPTGDATASVTFVGKMCRTAPTEGGETPKRDCVTNQDPKTDLPYFNVHVIETHHGWTVYFPSPKSAR